MSTVITINVTSVAAGLNVSHTLTLSDADGATLLAAYTAQFPGTTLQTILGWCTSVFSNMIGVANAYKYLQASLAVQPVVSTIT